MRISSTSLFHFTNRYEYFVDTLKNGFWPRYCVEPNWNGRNFAIPMICFCDIPLSQVQNHITQYGSYGIGIKKEFAKRNNITPVLYIDASSVLKYKYLNRELSLYSAPTTDSRKISFTEMMFYYIKRVEGRNGKKQVKFYDEKEWRYIPEINEIVHLEIMDDNSLSCKEMSLRTKKHRIKLTPDDIEYLIVRSENMIPKLCKEIESLFKQFAKDKQELLKTKILYVQQIKKDF